MYTQCPHCQQVQALDVRRLRAERGQVRCDACGSAFDALWRLVDDPSELAQAPLEADLDLFSASTRANPAEARSDVLLQEMAFPEDEPESALVAPHFLLDQHAEPLPHGGRWWLGVMAAALVLSLQLVMSQRAQLSEDPGLRPWLQRLCDVVKCDLPAFRDPAQIHLLTRDVQPHPSVPDALLISASFRNDANWAQAWPTLELSLSDLDGRLVALRRFRADEYLGQTAHSAVLEAGQPVAIELELVDPGKQAIAYEFNFL